MLFIDDVPGFAHYNVAEQDVSKVGILGANPGHINDECLQLAASHIMCRILQGSVPILSNIGNRPKGSDGGGRAIARGCGEVVEYYAFHAVSPSGRSCVCFDGSEFTITRDGEQVCQRKCCRMKIKQDGSLVTPRHAKPFINDSVVPWDWSPLWQLAFVPSQQSGATEDVAYLDYRGAELWHNGHRVIEEARLHGRKNDEHRVAHAVATLVCCSGTGGGHCGYYNLFHLLGELAESNAFLEVVSVDVLKPAGGVATGVLSVLRDLERLGMIPDQQGRWACPQGPPRRFIFSGCSMGGGVMPQAALEVSRRCSAEAVLSVCLWAPQNGGAGAVRQLPPSVSVWVYHGDSDTNLPHEQNGLRIANWARQQGGREVDFVLCPGVGHDLGSQDRMKHRHAWELGWEAWVNQWLSKELRRTNLCSPGVAVLPPNLFPAKHPQL